LRRGDFPLELVSNGRLVAREKAVVPFLVQEKMVQLHVKEVPVCYKGARIGTCRAFYLSQAAG
jgi:hypothetical protein